MNSPFDLLDNYTNEDLMFLNKRCKELKVDFSDCFTDREIQNIAMKHHLLLTKELDELVEFFKSQGDVDYVIQLREVIRRESDYEHLCVRDISKIIKGFHEPTYTAELMFWFDEYTKLQDMTSTTEIMSYITNPSNEISDYVTDDLSKISYVDDLKASVIVHIISERISYCYKKEKSDYIVKDDRVKKFFESITHESQDFYELLDKFNLSENTVKNFRRHDHLHTHGKVRRKTDKVTKIAMIWREEPTSDGFGHNLREDLREDGKL